MFGFWLFMIVLAVCITILCFAVIYYCGENEVGIFSDVFLYERKIAELEEKIDMLLEGK